MKKIINITLLIFSIFIFNSLKVNAFSSLDYENRTLCGYYEVAAFNEDGSIEQISCHNQFDEAKAKMLENGNDNVGIMTLVNGKVKLLDVNVGLLDLSVNPTTLTFCSFTNPVMYRAVFLISTLIAPIRSRLNRISLFIFSLLNL